MRPFVKLVWSNNHVIERLGEYKVGSIGGIRVQ